MKLMYSRTLSLLNLKLVMPNKNSMLVRYNSTNSKSGINNVQNLENTLGDKDKSLINPETFLTTRRIEGPVLDSRFPKGVSPWFICGFTDAEGNFDIQIFNNIRALAKTGIKFRFRLSANYRDVVLLCAIKNFFGGGSISLIRKDTGVISLEICSNDLIRDLIIPFFDKYPLKGTKYYDYLNWRNSFFDFLGNKDNLDSKVLLIDRLKEAKANLNNNKKEFLVPKDHLASMDPNYISGFCNGDGSTTLVTRPETFHKGFGSATLS